MSPPKLHKFWELALHHIFGGTIQPIAFHQAYLGVTHQKEATEAELKAMGTPGRTVATSGPEQAALSA